MNSPVKPSGPVSSLTSGDSLQFEARTSGFGSFKQQETTHLQPPWRRGRIWTQVEGGRRAEDLMKSLLDATTKTQTQDG